MQASEQWCFMFVQTSHVDQMFTGKERLWNSIIGLSFKYFWLITAPIGGKWLFVMKSKWKSINIYPFITWALSVHQWLSDREGRHHLDVDLSPVETFFKSYISKTIRGTEHQVTKIHMTSCNDSVEGQRMGVGTACLALAPFCLVQLVNY